MNKTIRRILALILGLCLLTGSLGLVSCAEKPVPLAELEGETVSVNMYRFFLSRAKGTLARGGYSVESADFWDSIVDKNNTTYDEYFRQIALTDVRRYLAALAIFEERELTLPDSVIDKIDEEIEEFVETAGSQSALNSELAAFGINMDMLREIYIMEAKFDYLQEVIYGKDGAKVGGDLRKDYIKENTVAFRQVLIRAFDYVYETDRNGDDIYFLPDQNNAKVNNIAYDKVAGTVRLDEFNKAVVDENGDTVYFLPNGNIAYDKENGVRAIVYDTDGNATTVPYSKDKLAEHKAAAEELLANVEKGDFAAFESLLDEYEISDDAFVTDGALCFLYTTGDNAYDYLNDIVDALTVAEVGELRMISSEYGYNVVMKYDIPDDVVKETGEINPDYSEWFTGLADRVVAELFHTLCEPYMERVKVDDEAFAALPSMKEIGTNYYY